MQTETASKKNNFASLDINLAKTCTVPWVVTKICPLSNYVFVVEFVDGVHGFVEMKDFINSDKAGVFEVLRDEKVFNQMYIDHGGVTWPGELDLAPDAMYYEIKKKGYHIVDF